MKDFTKSTMHKTSKKQVVCYQSSGEESDNHRHKEKLPSPVYNEKHKKQKHKKDDRKISRDSSPEKSENFSDSRAHRRYWDQEHIETDSDNESNRHEKNRFKEKRKEYRYSDDEFDTRHRNSDRTRPRNFRPSYKNFRESRYQRDYDSRRSRYTDRYDRNQSPPRYRDERYRYFSDEERFDERRNYGDRQDRNANRTMDRKRARSPTNTKDDDDNQKDKKPKTIEDIFTKAGGAYIPPAKLRMMQGQICDKSSESYQKIAWEALKKSINGFINKVNVSNLKVIITELFKENLVRGRYDDYFCNI
ncbi:pre-mRNA-splicing factor CWC22 homolog [Centruroides sculpturatus]|uniref:pre-mRNA-splicing factor CWC22 homolog n=1 Tax=Centruroides sculpturatus TaxID=218467 RepID=UPI000C6D736B|nr:pre-mRNA-splicing factor CWC22 homolog [Centruroides sculpturatus]